MSERKRVYHPETDEPFDLPVAKANDLVLNSGWRQQPLSLTAERLVQTLDGCRGTTTISDDEDIVDWRSRT